MSAAESKVGGGTSCLVIGGAGNLGSRIAEVLLERKYRVATFDLPGVVPSPSRSPTDVLKVQPAHFYGDVTCEDDLVSALRESEASLVFHTAALVDIRPVASPTMRKVNVDGTRCVLSASAHADTRVETIVYTSSLEVVSGRDAAGNVQVVNGVDEDAPYPAVHNLPYATTKCEAEQLVLAADGTTVTKTRRTIRTCAIRPGYIMGAGCIGLKIEILTSLRKRAGWYIAAKIPARISVVHARNCAEMHVLAAEQIAKNSVHGKAFFCRDFEDNVVDMNVTCFTKYTGIKCVMIPLWFAMCMAFLLDRIEHVLIFVYSLFGSVRETPMDVVSFRAAMMSYQDIVVSDKRGRALLGYQPTVGRSECLREAGEWCKEFYACASSEVAGPQKKTV